MGILVGSVIGGILLLITIIILLVCLVRTGNGKHVKGEFEETCLLVRGWIQGGGMGVKLHSIPKKTREKGIKVGKGKEKMERTACR